MTPTAPPGPTQGRSAAWSWFWPRWYAAIARLDGGIEWAWRHRLLGDTVRVEVVGRRSGIQRRLFLGLLEVGGSMYLGHPDGDCAWTLNLAAAGVAAIERADGGTFAARAVPLSAGPERDRAIRAAFRQHPFPGNALYRLSRAHVRATGRYFRVELVDEVG